MKSKSFGFTLVELMIVIVIVGIAAAVGLPSFTPMISKVRVDGEISALNAGLNFARSEAQKRGLPVFVCPSSDGATCAPSGTIWTNGWIVLLNDSSNQVLQAKVSYSSDTLRSVPTSTQQYPQFTSMGYTFFTGKLLLQDPTTAVSLQRCLIFTAGTWTSYTGAACS